MKGKREKLERRIIRETKEITMYKKQIKDKRCDIRERLEGRKAEKESKGTSSSHTCHCCHSPLLPHRFTPFIHCIHPFHSSISLSHLTIPHFLSSPFLSLPLLFVTNSVPHFPSFSPFLSKLSIIEEREKHIFSLTYDPRKAISTRNPRKIN